MHHFVESGPQVVTFL